MDLLRRCSNPLSLQLLTIATVSFFLGDIRSAVVVGGMIFLSVFLSYIQEARSTRAVEKLRKLVKSTTTALRDGKEIEVSLEELVPGDLVLLAAGSLIPADIRVLAAKDLFVSQAALTGESMAIEKNAETDQPEGKAVTEFSNACFMGSNVLSGTGRGIVLATGVGTCFGALADKLGTKREPTSFDQGINAFTTLMMRFMLVMVPLTFLIVGLTKHNWTEALLFALSVAVGLTPEMLPMIITVCLSKGALQMARKKVIVKRLHAIQNFGAMDVLCTDKTGTLTQDRVVLERYVGVNNLPSDDVLRYAYMNSYYQTGLRNLLDRAILARAELDVERSCRKVDEIPFDFKRRRMSVIIDSEERHVLICKGAVEEVVAACTRYEVDDEIFPLINVIRDDVRDQYRILSTEGYRVLAIAYREYDRTQSVFAAADESELVLLGYVAFVDPPKETAAQAIEALSRSGLGVKILTGDNELVTSKVCRDVGMDASRVLTGPQLAAMDPVTFSREVQAVNVFARLTPDQKELVIKSLRASGNVVGFMGDGINDVLAMKAADVGISVDTAVDVAKETADIILMEKSLLVLEDGIREGRRVFGNVVKYIRMGSSSNFGNMFSVVGAAAILPFLPMTPIQVLVNNLLYDVSQAGIPLDRVDEEFLKKPRKWDVRGIRNFMFLAGPISSIFDYATFALLLYIYGCVGFTDPKSSPAAKSEWEQLFHTGWFVESLLTQTLIVHVIRTRRIPFIQSRASGPMLFATGAIMAAAAWLPFSPAAGYLGFVPLPASFFGWMAAFLVAYSILAHAANAWFARRFENP